MTIQIEAVYTGGVLKPVHPLALPEGTEVRIAIESHDAIADPLAAVIGIGDGPGQGDSAERHDDYLYGKPSA